MIFGIENEPVAADLYKEYLLSLPDIKEVTVQKIGLILDKENNVLAASPDRIATIVYANGEIEYRNVEIKCLEFKRDMSPEDCNKKSSKGKQFPIYGTELCLCSERKAQILVSVPDANGGQWNSIN